jgi:hypothetical protein
VITKKDRVILLIIGEGTMKSTNFNMFDRERTTTLTANIKGIFYERTMWIERRERDKGCPMGGTLTRFNFYVVLGLREREKGETGERKERKREKKGERKRECLSTGK